MKSAISTSYLTDSASKTLTEVRQFTGPFTTVTTTYTAVNGPVLGCCGDCILEFPYVDVIYFPDKNRNTDCLAAITGTGRSYPSNSEDTRSAVHTKAPQGLKLRSAIELSPRAMDEAKGPVTAIGTDGFTL